jgi:type IVB pilus formation R64 PilN family outer membrane protein
MKFLIALTSAFLVVGCASNAKIDRAITSEEATAAHHVTAAQAAVHDDSVYRVVDQPLVTGAPVPLQPVDQGPPVLSQQFTYSATHDTLADAAAYLSDEAHINIRVSADALEHAAQVRPALATGQVAGAWGGSLTGSLRSILNQVTAATGVSWRWTGRNVLIYHLDTRSYTIEVLPPKLGLQSSIENSDKAGGGAQAGGGQSGGQQGGAQQSSSISTSAESGQKLESEFKFDPVNDAAAAVKAMLSKDGTVAVMQSAGSIVVRDTATVLDSVQQYVEDLNLKFRRRVDIELTMLTIEQTDSNTLGVNWNLVHQAVGDTFRFGFNAAGPTATDAFGIGATVASPTNPFSGSQILVDAIAKSGNTTGRRTLTVPTQNYQPSRVQSVSENTFLVNQTTVLVPQAGSITTDTTLTKTLGLSLTLLPVVLDDGSLLVDVQGSLSSLRGVRTVPRGGGVTLEFPQPQKDEISQHASMHDGETLVLTTLDSGDLASDERGLGSPKFFGLGGGKTKSNTHRTFVILLTPHVRRGI